MTEKPKPPPMRVVEKGAGARIGEHETLEGMIRRIVREEIRRYERNYR